MIGILRIGSWAPARVKEEVSAFLGRVVEGLSKEGPLLFSSEEDQLRKETAALVVASAVLVGEVLDRKRGDSLDASCAVKGIIGSSVQLSLGKFLQQNRAQIALRRDCS